MHCDGDSLEASSRYNERMLRDTCRGIGNVGGNTRPFVQVSSSRNQSKDIHRLDRLELRDNDGNSAVINCTHAVIKAIVYLIMAEVVTPGGGIFTER
jgi:hypothetical protein